MIKRSWPWLLTAMVLIASCQFLSDGGTEIPNELTGNLYLQSGGAAVNAQVTLYPIDFLPGDPASLKVVRTDAAGRFRFTGMPTGRYNLIGRLAAAESLYCFLDSLSVEGKVNAPSDTLKRPGSLTGKIQLNIRDNPATATVRVVGTDYFGLVDSNGIFTLKNVPQGEYELRVMTTLPAYAPATQPVTVQSGRSDTLTGVITPAPKHFTLTGSTVAQWTFDSYSNDNRLPDLSANAFLLTPSKTILLGTSNFGNAAVFNGAGQFFSVANKPALTVGGTGKITYEARVYLDQYPSAGNSGEAAFVLGFHEGLKLLIGSDGSLVAAAQKQAVGGAYAYSPSSAAGAVPLHRWVDLAVALDQAKNQSYGYIDGVPVQLRFGFVNADPFQVSTSPFTVGNDARDNQPFAGRIDEIRVSNNLINGEGLPLQIK